MRTNRRNKSKGEGKQLASFSDLDLQAQRDIFTQILIVDSACRFLAKLFPEKTAHEWLEFFGKGVSRDINSLSSEQLRANIKAFDEARLKLYEKS